MPSDALIKLTHIIQRSTQAENFQQQIQSLLEEITQELTVDVCSLFQQTNNKEMVLIASHGLTSKHPIVIPRNKGLVGQVALLRHNINLTNPAQHPEYYYIPHTKEERLHSFCGIPLVSRSKVIGVLVVQSYQKQPLPDDQEAILTTLAAHLSLLVVSLPEPSLSKNKLNEWKKGIAGAPGIAIGTVKTTLNISLKSVLESNCENSTIEMEKWDKLKIVVANELSNEKGLLEKSFGQSLASVVDAYILFLEDRSFNERVKSEILSGKSLAWSIKQAVTQFSEKFLAMEDPYLRAKHEDIEQLGEKLYQSLLGKTKSQSDIAPEGPIVLVGHQIGVTDIAALPTEQLAGIVCFEGAALSHIAIFANSLGIPAIMGVGELQVNNGTPIIVDAEKAQIFINPSTALINEYQKMIKGQFKFNEKLSALVKLPSITRDGIKVNLMANSGLQADLLPGLHSGADGIGLYRTEIPFMVHPALPTEDEQTEVYHQVIKAYQGKPIHIRTLDIGADKPLPYLPTVFEENPVLGLRGIRFTLDNLQILLTQFRAIMRAAQEDKNVHIILPMVSSGYELDKSIQLLDDAYTQLRDEGFAVIKPKLGVMIEIPSAISVLPFWSSKLDFVSIGTNDLSQYLLAIDRNNPRVAKYYDPLHPAVIHEINRIITICRSANIPISLCGEMASDPVAVFILLSIGIRNLSMSSAKIPLIKWLVRSINIADTTRLLPTLLNLESAKEIRATVLNSMRDLGLEIKA